VIIMANTYQYGDKEYTRQQVIDYGRTHYPKLYWIKRGIGIASLASAALLLILIFVIGEVTINEVGREYANLYYGDTRMIAYYIGITLDALIGIGLIISSFAKPTDEQCFIHGEKCLRQIAQDRAYFHKSSDDRQDF
jgi:hypothetical protein